MVRKAGKKRQWRLFFNMIRERLKIWLLIAVLTICGTASFALCSSNEDNATEQRNISGISDKVWAFYADRTERSTTSWARTSSTTTCPPTSRVP